MLLALTLARTTQGLRGNVADSRALDLPEKLFSQDCNRVFRFAKGSRIAEPLGRNLARTTPVNGDQDNFCVSMWHFQRIQDLASGTLVGIVLLDSYLGVPRWSQDVR